MGYIKALDKDCLEVFAGVFKSQQDVEDFLQMTDGVPKGLMDNLYLEGEFIGRVEYKFLRKNPISQRNCLVTFLTGIRLLKFLRRSM